MNDKQVVGKQQETIGVLYVVATPIGNLEDISRRATRVLAEVSLIAAEDTRHTRKLLARYGIHTPLLSYYKGREAARAGTIIEKLRAGHDVALVSDAGTPAVSDPGAVLVKRARAAGIRVTPVPGPSALISAISIAGLEEAPFVFLGFLPSRSSQRRKFISSIASESRYIIFYEAPHRFVKCLADCRNILGDRRMFFARELSKIHEESGWGIIEEILTKFSGRRKIKGELVIIIEGAPEDEEPAVAGLRGRLRLCRDRDGLTLRDAVRTVVKECGVSRSLVYKEALQVWNTGSESA